MPHYAITDDRGNVSAIMEADSIGVTSSGAVSFYRQENGLPSVFHVLHADAFCQVGVVERTDEDSGFDIKYVGLSRVSDFLEAS